MRKRIALALALGLALTVSLSACEQKKSAKKANRVSTEQADEDDEDESRDIEKNASLDVERGNRSETSESKREQAADRETESKSKVKPKQAGEQTTAKAKSEAIEPVLAADNEMYSITVNGIDFEADHRCAIRVAYENKTTDKTLNFMIGSVKGDDLDLNGVMFTDVTPGKKANEVLYLRDTRNYTMQDFGDLKLTFEVEDIANRAARRDQPDVVHIYPHGENSGIRFERAPGENDRVIVDNDMLKVTMIGAGYNELGNYSMDFYVENPGDSAVRFLMEKTSVNGYMTDAGCIEGINAHERMFASIKWRKSDLEKNQISKVETAEFTLKVEPADYFTTEVLFEQTFTVGVE